MDDTAKTAAARQGRIRGFWHWMSDWQIPASGKRLLPKAFARRLQEFKARILIRDFPSDVTFEQLPEDASAAASMSIIVPIHDAPRVTARCLASLDKYAREAEIILVDDESKLSETLEIIRNFIDRNGWKLIRHEKALGHSAACHDGARAATRPYLCLLNSDTVVTPWCWRKIKEVFDHDPSIGVAGPSTSNSGNVQTLTVADVLRPYWNDNQICLFASRLLTGTPEPAVVDLEWISGFALFIKRSVWEEVGGFDKNLPDYGNELELCGRIGAKGYRRVWVRDAYIHHFGRQSYRDTIGDAGIVARTRAAEMYADRNKRSVAP